MKSLRSEVVDECMQEQVVLREVDVVALTTIRLGNQGRTRNNVSGSGSTWTTQDVAKSSKC